MGLFYYIPKMKCTIVLLYIANSKKIENLLHENISEISCHAVCFKLKLNRFSL